MPIAIADLGTAQPPEESKAKLVSGGIPISSLKPSTKLSALIGSKENKPVENKPSQYKEALKSGASGLVRALKWVDDRLSETEYGETYKQQVKAAEEQLKQGLSHAQHAQGPLAPVEGLGGVAQMSLGALAYLFSPVTTLVEEGAAKPVKTITAEAAYDIAPHIRADQRESFIKSSKDLQDIEDFTIQALAGFDAGGEVVKVDPKAVKVAKVAKAKMASVFDTLIVTDSEAATALANHVEQVDSKTARYMKNRIQKFIDASEEELNYIGKRAADAAIAELEGNYDEIIKKGTVGYQGPEGLKYDENVKGKVGPEATFPEGGLSVGEGKASKSRTKSRSGPSDYGKNLVESPAEKPKEVSGRVYNVAVDAKNTLDFRNPTHRAAYEKAREKWNAAHSDPDDKLPKLTSEGFVSNTTGHVSYGHVRAILDAMPEFDSVHVDEGGSSPSIAVRDGKKVKIVEEDTGLYHGSPKGDLKNLSGTTFVTRNKTDAQAYAKGQVFGAGKKREVITPEKAGGSIRQTVRDATQALQEPPPMGMELPKERSEEPVSSHFSHIDHRLTSTFADMGKNKEKVSGEKLLDWMEINLPAANSYGVGAQKQLFNDRARMTKELFSALRKRLNGLEVHFVDEPIKLKHPRTGEDMDAAGVYRSRQHVIEVNADGYGTTHTILHEMVHAVTTHFLHFNKDHVLTKRLEYLRQIAEDYHKKSGVEVEHYGLSNVFEFAAESLTNARFQKFLSEVPLNTKSKVTLWSKLVGAVKDILGVKDARLLEITMRTTQDVIEAQAAGLKGRKPGATNPFRPAPADPNKVVYFNNGMPITAKAVREAFTFVDDLAERTPGVRVARAKLARLYESFIKTFNPEAMGAAARTAGSAIAQNFFKLAQKEHEIWQKGKARREYWQKMGEDAAMKFISQFEKGGRFSNPEWENARIIYKDWTDKIFRQDMAIGFEYDRVDHYMPHLFKDGDAVVHFMQKRYGNRWADPRFIKQRGYDLYDEAIKAGFSPKFKNPEEIMQARQIASDIAALRVDLLKDLERKGVAQKAKKGAERAPDGFYPETFRSPTGERYWIREEAQPLMYNAFDSKSLWAAQGLAGAAFRGFMEAKNKIVPVKLAASLFHPLHVMHIDAAADLARATKSYAGGNLLNPGRIGKFVLDMATTNVTAYGRSATGLVKSYFGAGSPILRVFQGKLDFNTLSDADKQAFSDLTEGGLIPTRPMEETASDIQKLKDAYYKGALTSNVWRFPWALLQGLVHPIYSTWIPSLKIASFVKDAKLAREMNPGWTATERQVAFRQLARKVEARYGEMNYQTMFMNKIAKDIGVATNLSLGWNLGLLDQYVGGAIDLGRAGIEEGSMKEKLASGRLDRPIFAAYYIGTAMMIGGLMHKFFTGQDPQSFEDYTHPKSGEKDKYGKDIRLNTMFYTREFEGLAKRIQSQGYQDAIEDFIVNKGSGMAAMAKSAWTGIDSLGNEIRRPNDPAYVQLLQTLAAELHDLEPISVLALNKSVEHQGKMGTLSVLGFTPAGQYISNSVTENKIENDYNKYVRPKEKPFESVQMTKDKNELRSMFEKDDPKYGEKLDAMAEKYDMDAKDIRRMEKQFAKGEDFDPSVFMFQKLEWAQQKALLDKMTPEEKDRFLPHISKAKRAKYERETEQ